MDKLHLLFASVPDKEGVVAELWCGGSRQRDDMVAELSCQNGEFVLEVFATRSYRFKLSEVEDIVRLAKQRLTAPA